MRTTDQTYSKAYTQGYCDGYRDARRDIRNGIDQLNIESDLLSHPIQTMGLDIRIFNSLIRSGFYYIRDITNLSRDRIIAIRGLGVKGRAEIARWLDENGIENTTWSADL